MAELRYEIKPYGVHYACGKCSAGFMIYTGRTVSQNPPRFQHACSECRATQNLDSVYPCVRWEWEDGKPVIDIAHGEN